MSHSFTSIARAAAFTGLLTGCGSGTIERLTPLPHQLASAPQIFQSVDFTSDHEGVPTLHVAIPLPSPGEQIAIFVMNVDGPDRGTATLSASGTEYLPPTARSALLSAEVAASSFGPDTWTMREVVRKRNEAIVQESISSGRLAARPKQRLAAALTGTCPETAPTRRTFCIDPPGAVPRRVNAVLKKESATALFYVDENDLAMYEPPNVPDAEVIWNRLADAWDQPNGIYQNVTSLFGQPSDVDDNCQFIVFFSSALDVSVNGILLGYFWSNDVIQPSDNSASCSGNRSNGADMVYLNALTPLLEKGSSQQWTMDYLVNVLYPSTLAHEFQHLVNFNQHCHPPLLDCSQDEESWVNEGLSMIAEDEAGYGWHPVNYTRLNGSPATERDESSLSSARYYLTRTANFPDNLRSYQGYDRTSLTLWEEDPIGNYQGVHSWFRYFTDRFGTQFLQQLAVGDLTGIPNFERAAGIPFSQALADFAVAMMFSNEDFSLGAGPLDFTASAKHSLTGSDWTPFHSKLTYLDYESLNPEAPVPVALRRNGWTAFLTGPVPTASAAPVSLTIRGGTLTPWVTIVRFKGALPR